MKGRNKLIDVLQILILGALALYLVVRFGNLGWVTGR